MLKDDANEEIIMLTLDCLEILLQKVSTFTKNIHKIETITILNTLIKAHTDIRLLKKIAQVYALIIENLDDDSVQRFVKL